MSNELRMSITNWMALMAEADVPPAARVLAMYAGCFSVRGNTALSELCGLQGQTLDKWKKWLVDRGWVVIAPDGKRGGRGHGLEVLPAHQGTPLSFTDVYRRNPCKISPPLVGEPEAKTPRKNTPQKITPLINPPEKIQGFTDVCITTRAHTREDNIYNIYNNNNTLLENIYTPVSEKSSDAPMLDLGTPSAADARKGKSMDRANDPDFDAFWAAFPAGRKQGKGDARKAYQRAKKSVGAQTILAAVKAYAASSPDPRYTPMPSTWLNQGRWEDENPPSDGGNPLKKTDGKITAFFQSPTGREMVARLGREGAEQRYLELLTETARG